MFAVRRLLRHHHRGRTQQPFAIFVALAQLLRHVALGNFRRLLLGNRFMQIGVERFARIRTSSKPASSSALLNCCNTMLMPVRKDDCPPCSFCTAP